MDILVVDKHVFGCNEDDKYWKVSTSANFFINDHYYYASGSPGYEIGSNVLIGYESEEDSVEFTAIKLEKPHFHLKIVD